MRLRLFILGVAMLAASASALAMSDAPSLSLTATPSDTPTAISVTPSAVEILATATARSLTLKAPSPTPVIPILFIPDVIESYPHDADSFTQGLVWNGETFYESAGLYEESDLREVDAVTGELLRQVDVPAEFFAEGLAQVDDKLIQITWQEHIAFVYDAETFEQIGTFEYETEGWGLCYDGEVLYMSDGTPNLYTRDPQTFELLAQVPLTFQGQPVPDLNELECVDGKVWGNIWNTDVIVRIEPSTGEIDALVDARRLLTDEEVAGLANGAVLNGIAYDPVEAVFYITGKKWPRLFKVTFTEIER